jgi:hypothetical protein
MSKNFLKKYENSEKNFTHLPGSISPGDHEILLLKWLHHQCSQVDPSQLMSIFIIILLIYLFSKNVNKIFFRTSTNVDEFSWKILLIE